MRKDPRLGYRGMRVTDHLRWARDRVVIVLLRHPTLAIRLRSLVRMPRLEPGEALSFLEEVEARFGRSRQRTARMYVAWAIYYRASNLADLSRTDEAIAAWEEVVRRFGDATVPALHWWVTRSMVRRALTLQRMGRIDDALAGFEDVERRVLDENASAALREQAASAIRVQGFLLGDLERWDEAIAADDRLVTRFGEYGEDAIRELVAGALNHIGFMQMRMERLEEAMAVYKEVERRFGATKRPARVRRWRMQRWMRASSCGEWVAMVRISPSSRTYCGASVGSTSRAFGSRSPAHYSTRVSRWKGWIGWMRRLSSMKNLSVAMPRTATASFRRM